jgi:hypothetical protein
MILQPDTHLYGRRLSVARAIWIVVVLLGLATWAASLAPRFDELRTPCVGEQCPVLTLSPQDADALQASGVSLELYAGYQVAIEIFTAGVYLLLALLVFWRRSAEQMGLFASPTLALMGTVFFSAGYYAALKVYPDLRLVYDLLVALSFVCLILLLYVFPDGRLVPRWARLLVVIVAAYLLITLFLPGGLHGVVYTPGLEQSILSLLLLVCSGMGIVAQVYRYRRVSAPTQRQQTKWVVFGLAAMVLGIFVFVLFLGMVGPSSGPARLYFSLGNGVTVLTIVLFPLTLAIAILRYRLWDIDLIIRRTLIYGVLTASLAFVYFGSVVLLQQLFRAFTGQQQSEVVTVVSTLAIAALFAPLRRRVQDVIDRRFYRRKYDAAKVLAEFAATARDETDLDKLTARLVDVVQETMQPAHVSLWLKKQGGEERRQIR